LVQSVGSKAASVSNRHNLDWMMKLRDRNIRRNSGNGLLNINSANGSDRSKSRKSNNSKESVPNVYYKETENLKR
jgi:hypothetical protein